MSRRLLLVASAVAALALGAAACGGGTTSTTSGGTAVDATAWANSVCTAFDQWKTAMRDIVTGVPHTRADLRQASRRASSTTEQLAKSLQQIGLPTTASSEAAKKDIEALKTSLANDVKTIEQATRRAPRDAAAVAAQISTVATTLAGMGENVKTAVADLKKYDPSGQLDKAFHQAASCSQFVS